MGWSASFDAIAEDSKTDFKSAFGLAKCISRVKKKMKLRGKQVTAARDLLGITQAELAEAAGVSRLTVFGFESGQTEPRRENLEKIQSELERRGIEFTNSDGMGVRLIFAKAEEAARGGKDTAP